MLLHRYGSIAASARWDLYNAMAESLRRSHPYLRIHYDDFVSHPGEIVARVLDLAGAPQPLDLIDRLGQEHLDLPVSHTVDGNPGRYRNGIGYVAPR